MIASLAAFIAARLKLLQGAAMIAFLFLAISGAIGLSLYVKSLQSKVAAGALQVELLRKEQAQAVNALQAAKRAAARDRVVLQKLETINLARQKKAATIARDILEEKEIACSISPALDKAIDGVLE